MHFFPLRQLGFGAAVVFGKVVVPMEKWAKEFHFQC